MSHIIKRVASKKEHRVFESVSCPVCGRGYSLDNKFREKFELYIGKPCKEIMGGNCSGVLEYEHHEWDAVIPGYVLVQCDCGRTVTCDSFTNTCSCGRDYNWSGDLLAPRDQWGEETGETAHDILYPLTGKELY